MATAPKSSTITKQLKRGFMCFSFKYLMSKISMRHFTFKYSVMDKSLKSIELRLYIYILIIGQKYVI